MYANYFNKYKYTPTKLVAFNSVDPGMVLAVLYVWLLW